MHPVAGRHTYDVSETLPKGEDLLHLKQAAGVFRRWPFSFLGVKESCYEYRWYTTALG